MGRVRLNLVTAEDTIAFGKKMASMLPKNAVVALSGDLGAGKTTFVQGLALGLGIKDPIQSPTFVLLNLYKGLYHFDLYRLKDEADFTSLGFEEYFHKDGICVIEWPERIAKILPAGTVYIEFIYKQEQRIAVIKS